MKRAKYQDFKEISPKSLGFEPSKIDYTSFRRNFGSLMNKEQMKEDRKKLMAIELEKQQKKDAEQSQKQQDMLNKFRS